MANSRKSTSLNKSGQLEADFERALGEILARVSVFASTNSMPIAVAYSGGLDSTVLLHLSSAYAVKHKIRLYAFHIHHGLSPNADMWMAHCEAEAIKCGAVFAALKVELIDVDKHGVEEAARIARYSALAQLCRLHQIPLLLTAHHQDDQAETVMLQLMRGAGLPGLSGMAYIQTQHGLLSENVTLGRPLLDMPRKALESFVRQTGLAHVDDESNADIGYRRNALRHDIFPAVETHFPAFSSLVARTASHVQTAQLLLHELADIDLAHCRADEQGRALSVPKLQQLSPHRIDNLLRHWLYAAGMQLPSTARLDELRKQMLNAEADKHPFFDFENLTLHRIGQCLELHPNLGIPPISEISLQWHGEQEIVLPQWHGRLVFEQTNTVGLDPEMLRRGPLALRPRSGQERLKIAGNRPSKSLKSLFQESSIAPWRRKWLPLLYLDSNMVFVAGLGMDIRHCSVGGIALRWETE